jgi:hypothetical protein
MDATMRRHPIPSYRWTQAVIHGDFRVIQQVAGTNRIEVVARAVTGADGALAGGVPPGPSRAINRGRWEPFRTRRTTARGRFRMIYEFQGGLGRFPFRAEVPAGESGFQFANGMSEVVNVVDH